MSYNQNKTPIGNKLRLPILEIHQFNSLRIFTRFILEEEFVLFNWKQYEFPPHFDHHLRTCTTVGLWSIEVICRKDLWFDHKNANNSWRLWNPINEITKLVVRRILPLLTSEFSYGVKLLTETLINNPFISWTFSLNTWLKCSNISSGLV